MSDNTTGEEPKHYFRPKARIMVLLGEQLIKNHTLALFELVKNSYDADASQVDLTLLAVDTKEGMIEVSDDGTGMSYEDVTGIWLKPAHEHKAEARKNTRRTEKGRLPIGEKGLGRFAVHRLGSSISMVTRKVGHDEVVVEIDWDTFLKNEYLDQSEISIETRKPTVFTGDDTGTRITVSNLRETWKRGEVRKLYRQVSSMTPPSFSCGDEVKGHYRPAEAEIGDEFNVVFTIDPDKKWLEDMFDPSLAVSQALFVFNFEMSDDGLRYDYRFNPFEAMKADYSGLIDERVVDDMHLKSSDFFKYSPAEDGISLKSRKKRSTKPILGKGENSLGIGPIKGTILGYDFDKEIYDRYQKDDSLGLTDYLRKQGGIRVYRDNLRVYNYGEPGDDWLHLDHRRIQGPTRKLGSRQIMGAIHLDLEESTGLIEQTNREGFVENKSYQELVHAMLGVLTQFEAERNKDKRKLKDILVLPAGKSTKADIKHKPSVEELITDVQKAVESDKAYEPLKPLMKEVSKAYQETRDVLMSAAGAGMGLVTVFHELERGVRNLHEAILEGIKPETLEAMSTELVSLLRGAMYMVNTKQMETINASRLVENVLLTQERRFKRHQITFLNGFDISKAGDFEIKGIRRMLTTTLVNLLDNAIYWTDDDDEQEKHIWIGPSNDLESPAIVIADSGPGFIDPATDIVQPFYTRKPSGMGIGLYYSDMVMKSHGGRLAFPEKGALDRPEVVKNGACIAMVFNRK
ncbi:MAG: ATP-binding protein [Candidatus Thiodiazotropha lotti]|nr:ATP-binding protein [Candidatus Thiodiazotropha lotti]